MHLPTYGAAHSTLSLLFIASLFLVVSRCVSPVASTPRAHFDLARHDDNGRLGRREARQPPPRPSNLSQDSDSSSTRLGGSSECASSSQETSRCHAGNHNHGQESHQPTTKEEKEMRHASLFDMGLYAWQGTESHLAKQGLAHSWRLRHQEGRSQDAKEAVMQEYDCYGHGETLVGGFVDDEIDLVIREAPMFF